MIYAWIPKCPRDTAEECAERREESLASWAREAQRIGEGERAAGRRRFVGIGGRLPDYPPALRVEV